MQFPIILVYQDENILPIASLKDLNTHVASTSRWRQASHFPEDQIVAVDLKTYRFCAEDDLDIAIENLASCRFHELEEPFDTGRLIELINSNSEGADRESRKIFNVFIKNIRK